jgi:hypothetical protein
VGGGHRAARIDPRVGPRLTREPRCLDGIVASELPLSARAAVPYDFAVVCHVRLQLESVSRFFTAFDAGRYRKCLPRRTTGAEAASSALRSAFFPSARSSEVETTR